MAEHVNRSTLRVLAAQADAALAAARAPPPLPEHLSPQQLYSKIERLETANAAIMKSLTALSTRVGEIDNKFTGLAGHYGTFTSNIIPRINALESRPPHGGRRRKTRKTKNKSTK
jgi:hypothetical protein